MADVVKCTVGGITYEFDALVPGVTEQAVASSLSLDDKQRIDVCWNRVPRRAMLVHLYDVLRRQGDGRPPRPALSEALAAWDDMHRAASDTPATVALRSPSTDAEPLPSVSVSPDGGAVGTP